VTRPEQRLAALIATIAGLDLVLWFTAVPLVPVWEREFGFTHVQSGIVLGAYGVAILVLSIPVGHIADRVGPRPVTIAATVVFAAIVPLFAFADTFWELVALRLVAGLFSAVGWTAGLAWLVVSVDDARHGQALATVNAGASAAAVLGPLVGGPVVAAFGIETTFLVFAVIVAAVAVWALLEPSRGGVHPGDERTVFGGIAASMRNTGVRQPILAILWVASTMGVVQLLAPIELDSLGLSAAAVGWTFTAAAVVSVFVAVWLRRRLDSLDKARVAGVGAALVTVCAAAFALTPALRGYQTVLIVAFGSCTLLWVTLYPLCSESARAADIGQGIALGTMNTMWALGAIGSPVAAGLIAQQADPAWAYAAVAVAGVATAAMLGLSRRRVPA
jgi:DHA1 family solute carrier family 18 vesicular amine transporter 1/2